MSLSSDWQFFMDIWNCESAIHAPELSLGGNRIDGASRGEQRSFPALLSPSGSGSIMTGGPTAISSVCSRMDYSLASVRGRKSGSSDIGLPDLSGWAWLVQVCVHVRRPAPALLWQMVEGNARARAADCICSIPRERSPCKPPNQRKARL